MMGRRVGGEGGLEREKEREGEGGVRSMITILCSTTGLKLPFDLIQSLIRTSAEARLIYTPFNITLTPK